MPIYNHNGNLCPPINISTFVNNVQNAVAPSGPLPYLNGPGNNLGVNATALGVIGPAAQITRAFERRGGQRRGGQVLQSSIRPKKRGSGLAIKHPA